ncbi:hypothetical protein Pmani_022105 [Petrolisthes manimaculis]|uniref:Gamma-interferon-inducible lysosomal thiol reductase n=1 Tax=Petrolisthes manimaculis TaxID=1843537 RepID=A0AAE1U1H7_9EUCA|nr:hypothetical protein Pmani_022105 [Petrolisthes manimaculis]
MVVLSWKIWDYTALPAAQDFKVKETLREQEDEDEDVGCCKDDKSILLAPAVTQHEEVEVEAFPPMRVEVYYEALCPDSRYFVIKHLLPTYNKLKDIITVALVPYGKASTHEKEGRYSFKCQHGPLECRANTVHACVTNLIKDETKQLEIVGCMIEKNDNPMKIGQKCVEKFGEQWESVEGCVNGEKGESILKHMGDMTHSLNPTVTFIPTILIDGSQAGQAKILQDLHKFLCRKYKGPKPASC